MTIDKIFLDDRSVVLPAHRLTALSQYKIVFMYQNKILLTIYYVVFEPIVRLFPPDGCTSYFNELPYF